MCRMMIRQMWQWKKDGVQYVSSTLCSGWYPDITVKAGEPVKWENQCTGGAASMDVIIG